MTIRSIPIRNTPVSFKLYVQEGDEVYTITYPSSLTNQSLSITTTNNDTVTTSNGVSVREVAINKYNFTLSGNTGYTPGNLIINGVEQSGSSVSNYVIAGNVVLSATEASYSGVIYSHTYSFGSYGNGLEKSYSLTTTNAVTGVTETTTGINTSSSFVISLPVNSTYSFTFTIDGDAYMIIDGTGTKTFTASRTVDQNDTISVIIYPSEPTPDSDPTEPDPEPAPTPTS